MTKEELQALMEWVKAATEYQIDSELGRDTSYCTEYQERRALEEAFKLEEYDLSD